MATFEEPESFAEKNDSSSEDESPGRCFRCEIFGFFLLSFPQNERKIY